MIRDELQSILRETLDSDDLVLTDDTIFAELPGWDSLAHINTLFAIEERFGAQFSTREISSIRSVAELTDALEKKGVRR